MQPIHKHYGVKKPTYGHASLYAYERNESGVETFTYHCECGRTWTSPTRRRDWHCGALDCPHLPRRKRQMFNPRPPGRPPYISQAAQALGMKSENEGSQSAYNRRVTFVMLPYERERLEEICTLLRISKSRAIQEACSEWCDRNNKAAYAEVVKVSDKPKKYRTAEELEEEREAAERSERYRKIYYRDGKTMDELFAVESSYEPMRNGKPFFGDRQGSR